MRRRASPRGAHTTDQCSPDMRPNESRLSSPERGLGNVTTTSSQSSSPKHNGTPCLFSLAALFKGSNSNIICPPIKSVRIIYANDIVLPLFYCDSSDARHIEPVIGAEAAPLPSPRPPCIPLATSTIGLSHPVIETRDDCGYRTRLTIVGVPDQRMQAAHRHR